MVTSHLVLLSVSLNVRCSSFLISEELLYKVAFTPPHESPLSLVIVKDKLPFPSFFIVFKVIVCCVVGSSGFTFILPSKTFTSAFLPITVIVHEPFGKVMEYCILVTVPVIVLPSFVAETEKLILLSSILGIVGRPVRLLFSAEIASTSILPVIV